jgi:glycosyltransferase involved in cell wall biosynthesis
MKILQLHNFYQQPGGEDQAYRAEFEMLCRHGHTVRQYSVHNDVLAQMSGPEMAVRTIWNNHTFRELKRLLRDDPPDVVHCHNTFPLISPAAYYAAEAAGVPVVQTLYNYRLLCPAGTLYRDGRVCEECLHSAIPYPGVLHACYRKSRAATACVATMLALHRAAGTWFSKVHTYIALTDFARTKFIEAGFPAARFAIKPNVLSFDPGPGNGNGGFALFVGRLAEEKGLRTLLRAWEDLPSIPLKVAGSGPLSAFVGKRVLELRNIEYLGACGRERIFELLRSAAAVVCPSEWYEGLPNTIVESLACGTPVVCAALGSMKELVREGVDGMQFEPGNAMALASVIRSMFSNPARLSAMRHDARHNYLQRYTPEHNYEQLVRIYRATAQDAPRIGQSENDVTASFAKNSLDVGIAQRKVNDDNFTFS